MRHPGGLVIAWLWGCGGATGSEPTGTEPTEPLEDSSGGATAHTGERSTSPTDSGTATSWRPVDGPTLTQAEAAPSTWHLELTTEQPTTLEVLLDDFPFEEPQP